jgi:predicted nucleotidyltransferase
MIEALASLRLQLIDRLRETIEGWDPAPLVAVLFGSAARGEAGEESDLDILIVRSRGVNDDDDSWRKQIADLEEEATAWTGNDTRVLEYGQQELPSLIGSERVIRDAVTEGILLYGSMTSLEPHGRRAK